MWDHDPIAMIQTRGASDPSLPAGFKLVRLGRNGPRGRQTQEAWLKGKEVEGARMVQRMQYGRDGAERLTEFRRVGAERWEKGVVLDGGRGAASTESEAIREEVRDCSELKPDIPPTHLVVGCVG